MAKKQQVSFDTATGIVKVAYPTLGKSVCVCIDSLTNEMKREGLAHGIKQRLGDAASGESAREKYEMASRIVESLLAGSWDIGQRSVDTESIVIAAVARVKGVDEDTIRAALPEEDSDERAEIVKQWRTHLKVKAAIAKIKAERAEAEAETSADDLEIEGLDD